MKYLNTYRLFESNDLKWYHGTDATFDEFKENPDARNSSAIGIWATEKEDFAEMFGENTFEVRLEYSNPFEMSFEEWWDIRGDHAGDTEWFKNLRKKLINQGYDALYIPRNIESTHTDPATIAVFNSSQISKA